MANRSFFVLRSEFRVVDSSGQVPPHCFPDGRVKSSVVSSRILQHSRSGHVDWQSVYADLCISSSCRIAEAPCSASQCSRGVRRSLYLAETPCSASQCSRVWASRVGRLRTFFSSVGVIRLLIRVLNSQK